MVFHMRGKCMCLYTLFNNASTLEKNGPPHPKQTSTLDVASFLQLPLPYLLEQLSVQLEKTNVSLVEDDSGHTDVRQEAQHFCGPH